MKAILLTFSLLILTATADNAALQYWQAFALMPPLDEEAQQHLQNWKELPLDAEVLEAMASIQPAIKLMHTARKSKTCDWGIDFSDGFNTVLPHLAKARELSMAALLDSRLKLANGHTRDAIDQALAIITLARHTGTDASMIGVLVQSSIESSTLQLLAHHWGDFSDSNLQQLRTGIASLPVGGSIPAAMKTEQKFTLATFENGNAITEQIQLAIVTHLLQPFGGSIEDIGFKELKTVEQVIANLTADHFKLLSNMLDVSTPQSELVEALRHTAKVKMGGGAATPAAMSAFVSEDFDQQTFDLMVNELKSLLEEQQMMMTLSPADFKEANPRWEKSIAQSSKLSQTLLPSLDSLYRSHQRQRISYQMLNAALAHRLDGKTEYPGLEATLDAHQLRLKDPSSDDELIFHLKSVTTTPPTLSLDGHEDKRSEAAEQVHALANAKNNGTYENFKEEIKHVVAGALEGGADLQISEQEGHQLLDVLMKHAIAFALQWDTLFTAAEKGDASATSATFVFTSLRNPKAQLIRHAMTEGDAEFRKLVGDQSTEYIQERVREHVGW